MEIDGEVKFIHNDFDRLDYSILKKRKKQKAKNADGEEEEESEEEDEFRPDKLPDTEFETFDLEEYTVPSIVRKLLKTTKLREVVEVRTTSKQKLQNYFDTYEKKEATGALTEIKEEQEEQVKAPVRCFNKELLNSFEHELVITFALLGFQ